MKVGKIIMAKDRKYGGPKDRIHVAMSPAEVDTARNAFRTLAVSTNSYPRQTEYREFKEFFDEVYDKWEKADDLSRQKELEKDT